MDVDHLTLGKGMRRDGLKRKKEQSCILGY